MANKEQFHAQDFIDAIPGTGGIKATIAARVGCEWHTADKYIKNYATVKKAYDDECERVADAAETNIINDIVTAKDIQTSKWYLTMKGGDRGYAPKQRQEVTGPGGGPLTFKEIVVELPADTPVED